MKARRLYLHIGSHKTGSTSIQAALASNAQALGKHGLHFFREHRFLANQHPAHAHSWLHFANPAQLIPEGMSLADPARFAERLAAGEEDLIVSSENFSFFFQPAAIQALAQTLRQIFSEIRVICYLRRQDRHLVSHHQEGAKNARRAEYALFGHDPCALPDYQPRHRLYLDYCQRIGHWADAFGDENLIVRIFDRSLLHEGDVVCDFFKLLGIEQFRKPADRNVSQGLVASKLGHLINASTARRPKVVHAIVQAAVSDNGKLQPGREQARAYYTHYAAGNAELNRRLGISALPTLFAENFDDYPEEASEAWNDGQATQVFTQLLTFIDQHYGELAPQEWRDAALLIGPREPKLAAALLRIALLLQPDDASLQGWLNEFQQAARHRPRQ